MPDPPLLQSEPLLPLAAASNLPPSPPSPAPYFRPPRLGIIHLLAWITITALLYGCLQSLSYILLGRLWFQDLSFLSQVLMSFGIMVNAAEFVAMSVILRGRFQGDRGRWQPGYYWIVVNPFIQIFGMLDVLIWGLLGMSGSAPDIYLQLSVNCWLRGALFCWWAFRIIEPRRWKIFLMSMGLYFVFDGISGVLSRQFVFSYSLSTTASGFLHILFLTPLILASLSAGSCIVAGIWDLIQKIKRDWIYGLGILCSLYFFLLEVIEQFHTII